MDYGTARTVVGCEEHHGECLGFGTTAGTTRPRCSLLLLRGVNGVGRMTSDELSELWNSGVEGSFIWRN